MQTSNANPVDTLQGKDGGSIAYRDTGQGPPILFIHGWGANGRFFESQARALANSHRIINPDLRGHGDSTPFAADMDFAVLADDLAGLIDHLELESVLLIGWSLGAMVAWDLLDRYRPSAVSGLVSIDMVPRLLNTEDWRFGLRDGRDRSVFARAVKAMQVDWPDFTGVYIPRIFATGSSDIGGLIRTARGWAAENDPASLANLWMELVEQDFRENVARIQVPTLIIYGEGSRLYQPAASAWLQDRIPGSKRLGFANSGHAPHLEEPDRFTALIRSFSEGLQTGPDNPKESPASAGQAKP